MTFNDLSNPGQVVGALAVVISLIHVAYQIRQNTFSHSEALFARESR